MFKKSVIYRLYSIAILYLLFRSVKLVVMVEAVKLLQYYLFEKLYAFSLDYWQQRGGQNLTG